MCQSILIFGSRGQSYDVLIRRVSTSFYLHFPAIILIVLWEVSECCRHVVCLSVFRCALSMLAVSSIPAQLSSATVANSMTLRLADWLALPAIPLVVSLPCLSHQLSFVSLSHIQQLGCDYNS